MRIQARGRRGPHRGTKPPSTSIGWGVRLTQALIAAAAGAAYGRAAEAGFGAPALQGLVALLAASGVVVVLGQEHLRDALDRGVGTSEREGYGVRALLLTIAPPLAIAGTLIYLASYEHGGPLGRLEEHTLQVGVVFGVLVAVLVWLLVAAATTPLLALAARKRAGVSSAPWPPVPADLAGLPWPDTFHAPPEDPYENDAFEREDDVRRFCELLVAGRAPAVWALAGPWGSGKSAFARMAAAECERQSAVSKCIEVSAPAGRLGGAPLFDLAAALAHGLTPADAEERHGGLSRIFDLARSYAEPVRLAQELRAGDDPRGTLNEFAGAVRELVEEAAGRVVLWIDDLDRCPPDYALEMLHAVRAVTACRNLSTVLVVNHKALVAAADHRYGLGPEAGAYLDRFIDFRIDLPPLSGDDILPGGLRERWMLQRAETIGLAATMKDTDPLKMLTGAAWTEELSLRDLEQIVYRASVVLGSIPRRLPPLGGGMDYPDPFPDADRETISLAVCAHVLLNVWDHETREQALGLATRETPPRPDEMDNLIGSAPFIPCVGGGPSFVETLKPALAALRSCHHEHYTRRVPDLSIISGWANEITPPRVDV
ncbi:MAG: P-loop NTPase fold protein [bacterium]|nr:P-loop NTPase fold protein [bacterium]